MSKKIINWGIIGVGDVCEEKSGPAFQKIEGSELVAVMRRNAELAEDFAKRHNVPKFFSNAKDLLNDEEINAVYIATPPNLHEHYAILAAQSGKIVYVEKPMALTYQECQNMINACKKANVPLFVAYYRRALPNFLKIKSFIEEGVIGEIRYVDIKVQKTISPDIISKHNLRSWRTNPEIAGGGYFYDLACHQLDYLDFLFGKIIKAEGYSKNQGGKYEADDIVIGNFVFENGVLGQGNWCFSTSTITEKEITTIVGSKGEISFSFFGDFSIDLKIVGKPIEHLTFDIPKNIQQPFIQTIIDELNGVGICQSHGESGSRTNWVMEQLCRSI
jgi:predicted dehydrogenase